MKDEESKRMRRHLGEGKRKKEKNRRKARARRQLLMEGGRERTKKGTRTEG